MATPRIWKNVAVAVQSALAASQNITAITKASPGVVTCAATAPATGAFVILTVQGMTQVTNRVFRVINLTTTTFSLEGEDTTLYSTFVSGSFQTITYGVSVTTATTVNASGGDFPFINTTTIHDAIQSQIPGLPNPITYSFDNIWDITDGGLIALRNAGNAGTSLATRFTFGVGGPIMVFSGFPGASLAPTGQAQQLITTPAVITVFGAPTYYAS